MLNAPSKYHENNTDEAASLDTTPKALQTETLSPSPGFESPGEVAQDTRDGESSNDVAPKTPRNQQSRKSSSPEKSRTKYRRHNYYSRDSLKAASLQGKANSNQSALVFHVRRLLYRFVRLYFWIELSERLETSPGEPAIGKRSEDIETALNCIKMLQLWIESFSNRESFGHQNVTVIKQVLVKLRFLLLQNEKENEALLSELDDYTGSLLNKLPSSE
eukprot:Gregarina_sp_Poly_1__430@NODE_1103_length_5090_cov_173_869998_g764_i0_p4_GENE_NODE_1103_length_5090_cov_173_869998_g764_i0NODE_1103_length_5090_cov_173_869998_g764_i0_p4_ORF_typecomplete_len218_score36_09_NODE_1103_length_5090_cov_173_869998_g764_i026973350